jgi:pimeloyl-ACP methyl ester carboxylesterase
MIRPRIVPAAAVVVLFGALLVAQTAAPPQARKLSANGADLTYVDEGKGVPVVFVHGAIADLRFWEPQRQAFASKYRFIAYTYRYHGVEPWPDDGKNYSAATHIADLTAFLTNLKAGPVHVVGLSYGGILGAAVAAEHPELVRSLTLAEPALFALIADKPEAKPALDAFGKGFGDVAVILKGGDRMGALKGFYALVTGNPAEAFDAEPEPSRRMFEDNARTMQLLLASPEISPITCDTLRTIKTPTLVVEGARTPAFFSEIDKVAVSCITGSRLVKIPDASHPMSADNPAAFNKAVLEFIAKQ